MKNILFVIIVILVLLYNVKNEKKVKQIKKIMYLFIFFILFQPLLFTTKIKINQKIYLYNSSTFEEFAGLATAEMQRGGIFASLTLAQAAVEQGLKAPGNGSNNYFGIKANCGWTGPTVNSKTGEYYDGSYTTIKTDFRAYPNKEASFSDHTDWLRNCYVNRSALVSASDIEGQLKAMGRYATSPTYICSLVDVINNYDLTKYDGEQKKLNRNEFGCGGVSPVDNKIKDPNTETSNEREKTEHYSTSYGGSIEEGWMYNRQKTIEKWKQFEIGINEDDIDDAIDEVFRRAKLSYDAYVDYYGDPDSNENGPSAGYSVKDCDEMAKETNYGDYSTWRQGYDLWSNIKMGSSNLGDSGCLITSIAIQLQAMGVNTGIDNFNPGTFACHLARNGKFTEDGSLYGDWANVVSGVSLNGGTVKGTREEQASQMQSLINNGCHLVIYAPHSGSSHYVAVSGTTSDNIKIIDPGAGKTLLWGNIYDYNNTTGYRCLKAS